MLKVSGAFRIISIAKCRQGCIPYKAALVFQSCKFTTQNKTNSFKLLKEKVDLQSQESKLNCESKNAEINLLKEKVDLQSQESKLNCERLNEKLERATRYKMYYRQLSTILPLIEKHEMNFGAKLANENVSRFDKWNEYLSMNENFKPFQDRGFKTAIEVSCQVDAIYNSHLATIHSIECIEGFTIEAAGMLNSEELKVVQVIVNQSGGPDGRI